MTFIADLHIHSRHSRATSQELTFEQLHAWGRRKGVALIGTGDCTHPGWLAEIREKLLPDGDGLFRLRDDLIPPAARVAQPPQAIRFLLTGEISTIYKAAGATRKVHHVVCLPGLDAAERFAARLARIGNIASDGRPILGLDARDLLDVLLEADPAAALIPAHIWTPWFSVLGSKSGFDCIEDCYRDLAGHIFALETGLSSDPPMNWRVSGLDRYTLVSNSDAHSPARLGREANVFNGEMGYTAVMRALKRETPDFGGTLEFFPEEGKYHADGHRKCNLLCTPEESRHYGGRCPVCGGPLTLGVEYRVCELADRPRGARPAGAPGFRSLLSLAEILGEVHGTAATSKKVLQGYDRLLAMVGPELHILLEAELPAISAAGGPLLACAIEKMRRGEIHATPGYDGEYGVIRIFSEEERAAVLGQIQLFGGMDFATPKAPSRPQAALPLPEAAAPSAEPAGASPEQERAIAHPPGPLLIVAGPGAGKTRTLVERIAWLVDDRGIAPAAILALTFSNRAAREMSDRLAARLPERAQPLVATFHKLGYRMIAEQYARLGLPASVAILPEDEAQALFTDCLPDRADARAVESLEELERTLAARYAECAGDPAALLQLAAEARQLAPAYAERKRERGALDFTDLLILPLALLAGHADLLAHYRAQWPHVFVDEYQDVNVFQYLLLRLLCPPGADLCAIGDPDQAIYGFRGADVRYFLRFTQEYPGAGEIALTRNYRSTRAIVAASTQVIAGDPARADRRLWSTLDGPAHVEAAALPTPAAEAEYVVQSIEALLGGISHFSVDSGRSGDGGGANLGFNDIAVLYRTHALGEEVQRALTRSGIPFQRAARQDIFQRPDVRKALEYLRSLPAETSPVRALLQAGGELGLPEDAFALPPWSVLLAYATREACLEEFLRMLDTEQDIDCYDPRAARVALMTVHAAKGLEWEVVFMLGCEAGAFPHPAAPLAEERRLFYVGMTRARRQLHLCHAKTRLQHGERAPRYPSPFLEEISRDLLHDNTPRYTRPKPAQTQLAMTDLFG